MTEHHPYRSPRAESICLTRSEELAEPGLADPAEIIAAGRQEEVLERMKPLQYAWLARTIELQLDDMFAKDELTQSGAFTDSTVHTDDPWVKLRADILATSIDSIASISDSPIFQATAKITRFIGTVQPDRFSDLSQQLDAGMDTATNNMLMLLKNLPAAIQQRAQNPDSLDYEQVARASMGLSWPFAMTCVEKMLAARESIVTDFYKGIIDVRLLKVLSHEDDSASLRFSDFSGIIVPEGYRSSSRHPGLEQATTIGKLACHQAATVGCPITLLRGKMQELWDWHIDLVIERGLWNR